MGYSRRERIGYWIERHPLVLTLLAPFVLEYNSTAPDGQRRYVNRINHHLVMR